jgi:hypothetical protein
MKMKNRRSTDCFIENLLDDLAFLMEEQGFIYIF